MQGLPQLLGHQLPRIRSAVLTVGAVLGTLCLLGTVVAPVLGIRPLIFLSGSMSPAIPAGSLALARTVDAADLEVGDVVTVPANGSYVTHRIVEVTHAPGKATLLLRGDGNEVADANAYVVTSAPRTFFSVPRVGSVVAWFSRAPGVYVLAGWVALVIGSIRRGDRGPRPEVTPAPAVRTAPTLASRWVSRRRGLVPVQAFVGVLLAAPWLAPTGTLASDVDAPGPATAPAATAAPTPVPDAPRTPLAWCRSVDRRDVTVGWTPVADATGYQLIYRGQERKTATVPASTTAKTFSRSAHGTLAVRAISATGVWISASSNQVALPTDGADSCG